MLTDGLQVVLKNLAAGTVLVALTVTIHAVGLLLLTAMLRHTVDNYTLHRHRPGTIAILGATVLGLFVIHTVEIWAWAIAYLSVGAIQGFEPALFFSTLSFSTLGAEGISLDRSWGLFGSIEGVNGFLLIGWSTAYMIPAWSRYGPFRDEDT